MKELLQQLIDKGFKASTASTTYTVHCWLKIDEEQVNDTCKLLLLEEIKAWFRNEHNLHIGITINQFNYGYMYSIIDIKKGKCIVDLVGGPNEKFTYELALFEGIKEANKLIRL